MANNINVKSAQRLMNETSLAAVLVEINLRLANELLLLIKALIMDYRDAQINTCGLGTHHAVFFICFCPVRLSCHDWSNGSRSRGT